MVMIDRPVPESLVIMAPLYLNFLFKSCDFDYRPHFYSACLTIKVGIISAYILSF